MADNVSIEFSAQIGQLISGVDKVKEAISSDRRKRPFNRRTRHEGSETRRLV